MLGPFLACAQQEDFLTRLTLQLGDRFVTDLTLSQMEPMLELLDIYKLDKQIRMISGTAEQKDGRFQFYADPDAKAELVDMLFY